MLQNSLADLDAFQVSEADFWKAQCRSLKGEVEEGKEECRQLVSCDANVCHLYSKIIWPISILMYSRRVKSSSGKPNVKT